jgi:hypothetical protein
VADLNTLATNVKTEVNGYLLPHITEQIFFTEVVCLDIATDTGNVGVWSGSIAGGLTGAGAPEDAAMQITFDIGRRYRGGKPKIFLPPSSAANVSTLNSWDSTMIAALQNDWGSMMAAILAGTYSSFTLTDNVNVSYYHGFTVFTTPSGRARNIPTQRSTPLVDNITNHTARIEIASQRRRRTAFTG